MHDVPDIHAIRVLQQRGLSKRGIARTLRLSRKTVDKYTAPGYVVPTQPAMRLATPRPAPKMDRWKPVVEEWLLEDEGAPRKQRRTARRIYKDLVEQYDADVSEVTVRRYVARCRNDSARQAFVPLEFPPGEMIEADFGHARVVLDGKDVMLPFFAMRLMASRMPFVKAYPHEQMEALLDGVASGLSFLGGVPRKVMFDNTGLIVKGVLGGGQRLQTPEFKALCAHYGFEAVFANLAAGNEKGSVETLVGWVQRNLFSPVPKASSLTSLNESLHKRCLKEVHAWRHPDGSGRTLAHLWDEEAIHLAPLPREAYPACRNRFARVSKTLLVTYRKAVYSVPAQYPGKALMLRAFWDHIEIVDGGRVVAIHERGEPGSASLQLEHYLPVLAKKPRAVGHAAVIAHGEPAIARYRDNFLDTRPGAFRELVAILQLAGEQGVPRLATVLATADRCHTYDLESVKALLAMNVEGVDAPTPLNESQLERWPETAVAKVASADYAWHAEVAAGRDRT